MNGAANKGEAKAVKVWGKPGDVVIGRKNGREWRAVVGPSGKLIGRVWS